MRRSIGRPWNSSNLRLLLAACFLAFLSPFGKANEITAEYDSSVAGQLVPKEESEIQVIAETLEIRFQKYPVKLAVLAVSEGSPGLAPTRAEVTARYDLWNPASESRDLRLAFPILYAAPEQDTRIIRHGMWTVLNDSIPTEVRRGVRSEVKVSSKPIAFEYVTFDSLFGKERKKWAAAVREWLRKNPARLNLLDTPDKPRPLREQQISPPRPGYPQWLPLLSFHDSGYRGVMRREDMFEEPKDLADLLADQACRHQSIEEWDLDFLSYLYARLHPEDDTAGQFLSRWEADDSVLSPVSGRVFPYQAFAHELPDPSSKLFAPIDWDFSRLRRCISFLEYRVTCAPGETTQVEVHYSHLLNSAMWTAWDNENHSRIYEFQYILRTSNKWKTFGPISISLAIPAGQEHAISLPLEYQGIRDNSHRYALRVGPGSRIVENLLVAMGRFAELKDNEYPSPVDLPTFWEKYQKDPTGPFAAAYLERMRQKVRSGALRDAKERALWCKRLGIVIEEVHVIQPDRVTEVASGKSPLP